MKRTLAAQTPQQIEEKVTLKGWVNTRRDHGKIVFLDLRDRSGLVQVVSTDKVDASPEDVVEIIGTVKKRPESLINPKLDTGTIEIEAEKISIISSAKEMPLPIDTKGDEIKEEVRLKYRYLDLRRPRMAKNIRIRSKVSQFVRNWLSQKDFVEIETPILTKTTPEGARDFLVPSRLQPGNFYALPQSPQQYKQMLMVSGFERYFQFARCFRDEDPRADRAYGEFTQLDMEMSFVTQEDILELIEAMFTDLVKELFPEKHITKTPWPRISHKEAIEKYGTDKPDLRKDKNDPDELAFSWTIDFPLFTEQSDDDFFHGSGAAKFAPSHHMFTSPHPDDIPLLDTDPTKARGLQHDLVLNGFEVGGGSIRIHDAAVQQKVFDLIGFSEEQKQQFEHILTAFTYGVPPHGGIAPGLDRFMMAILGEPSVREVMAFPTAASGRTAVVDAPSAAAPEQLAELGLNPKSQTLSKDAPLYDRIISKLESLNVKSKKFEHQAVFTSEEAAEIRGTDLKSGAKALLMLAEKKPQLIVVSAATKVDTNALKKLYNIKDLRMASREEVKQYTGVEVGAVPPFGSLMGIKTYVDSKLGENKQIDFNAGDHKRSLEISYQDYIRVEQPEIGEFSK